MAQEEYSSWKELTVLQDTTIKLWQTYISWFTWFFGINLLALGWIFTSPKVFGEGVTALAVLMAFCDLLGIATAIFMQIQHHTTKKRAAVLDVESDIKVMFADNLARFASVATALTLVAALLVWILVAFSYEKIPSWLPLQAG